MGSILSRFALFSSDSSGEAKRGKFLDFGVGLGGFEDKIRIIDDVTYLVEKSLNSAMKVPGLFFLNEKLIDQALNEIRKYNELISEGQPSYLPSIIQLANVASLPGIVGHSIGLSDLHSGYGFAIGNVAAFDTTNEEAIVSPGGVGFDINCGVRVLETNITYGQIKDHIEELGKMIFDLVYTGPGVKGKIEITDQDLEEILEFGIDWAIENGFSDSKDKEHCEDCGCMKNADPSKVAPNAKSRGKASICSIGTGNHYAEIQRVVEIFDKDAAKTMGIREIDQIVVMIHTGSRGLGHQVATDYLKSCNEDMNEKNIEAVDPQLSYVKINSTIGRDYLSAMAAAANFAFVNRSLISFQIEEAFRHVLDFDGGFEINLIYDVCHNIAKFEDHTVLNDDGTSSVKKLLVHRKGATRAFPPGHPEIPEKYKKCGQPVFVGGSMGTSSYILKGMAQSMQKSFGTTCHGAGRALPRSKSRLLDAEKLQANLDSKGIRIFCRNKKLLTEEAPEAYKDVEEVVKTCELAGLSSRVAKVVPIATIKG